MEILNAITGISLSLIPFLIYWLVSKGLAGVERSEVAKKGWKTKYEKYSYKKYANTRKNRLNKAREAFIANSKPIKVNDFSTGSMYFIKRK